MVNVKQDQQEEDEKDTDEKEDVENCYFHFIPGF